MNATFTATTKTRIAAFAAAVVTSTAVLGATVFGMQADGHDAAAQVVAADRTIVTGPALN